MEKFVCENFSVCQLIFAAFVFFFFIFFHFHSPFHRILLFFSLLRSPRTQSLVLAILSLLTSFVRRTLTLSALGEQFLSKVCVLSGCSHVKCHDYDEDYCRYVYGRCTVREIHEHFWLLSSVVSQDVAVFHVLSLSHTHTNHSNSYIMFALFGWMNHPRSHFN